MDDAKLVSGVIWSDLYYDQVLSLVDYIIGHSVDVIWCKRSKILHMKDCLVGMASMDVNESVWDYGDRSVHLDISESMESMVYRLMSEHAMYGFSFSQTDSFYSLCLLDIVEAYDFSVSASDERREFLRERRIYKRQKRQFSGRQCLENYLEDCRLHDKPVSMDGYVKACGSRRMGRKIWRKYMTASSCHT